MLICFSGSYIGQEMSLHLGVLPPAFLPVGSERLFQLQHRLMAQGEPMVLTLPSDYTVPARDLDILQDLGIELVFTDPKLSLCDAVCAVLDHLPQEDTPVRLLFGDTLVQFTEGEPAYEDFVAIKPAVMDYPWLYADQTDGNPPSFFSQSTKYGQHLSAVCGYFRFSDPALIRQAFKQGSLKSALELYVSQHSCALTLVDSWHDFGHLTLYYQSKRDLLVARSFNALHSDGYSIIKTSKQTRKIRAEAAWYENLPDSIALHAPRYLGRKDRNFQAGYRLEYLYLPTISDIAVFGQIPIGTWSRIVGKCLDLMSKFHSIRPDQSAPEASPSFSDHFYNDIIVGKTWERIEEFCKTSVFSLDSEISINGRLLPPLREVIADVIGQIPRTTPGDICFWHGDFFFGNLFFDLNTQRVIMVDPRGQLGDGTLSQFGDYRYDLGKLAHSILGGYDHILLERCTFQHDSPHEISFQIEGYDVDGCSPLGDLFLVQVQESYELPEPTIRALGALMFFSMLPLHADDPDRQKRLLASGLNQYSLLRR